MSKEGSFDQPNSVCLGGICRSPAAEGVFRALATGGEIDSTGTAGWHIGKRPPYGPMQKAAKARGYDLSELRARQFIQTDFDGFDLIEGAANGLAQSLSMCFRES